MEHNLHFQHIFSELYYPMNIQTLHEYISIKSKCIMDGVSFCFYFFYFIPSKVKINVFFPSCTAFKTSFTLVLSKLGYCNSLFPC